MNAAEMMTNEVSVVDLATSVADAARMMREQNTGCLIVAEEGALAGIITERDMVLGCLIDGHTSWKCEVYRHMTILTEAASPGMDIGEALLVMMEREVSHLPVVDGGGRIVGMLFAEDLARAIEQDGDPLVVMADDFVAV